MSELPAAVGLLGLSVVAFVAAIRIGILLGRGLDRTIESRRAAEAADEAESNSDQGGQPGE